MGMYPSMRLSFVKSRKEKRRVRKRMSVRAFLSSEISSPKERERRVYYQVKSR